MTKPKEIAIAREYFPGFPDSVLGYILWNETGWPNFFNGDVETELRVQLREAAAKVAVNDKAQAVKEWMEDPDQDPPELPDWSSPE